tara:strand:+ start:119 stop:574 length:456 start_codon:yes stop_codon:yes gene_type:complete
MEINEDDTRQFNHAITFVLRNVFTQDISNPFLIINNAVPNIEQEIIDFTLQQSLQSDDGLKEDQNLEIDEPIVKFANIKNKHNSECSICMEEFKSTDNVFQCGCHYIYHYECINKWIKSKEDCPSCRKKIKTKINLVDDYFLEWVDNNLNI